MKNILSIILRILKKGGSAGAQKSATIGGFLILTLALVAIFTIGFHWIMLYEGREQSWISGLYWTFTVMSTLGFGDVTFYSDLGRVFSIIVLLSGMVLLLTMMPFVFMQHIYIPWMEKQKKEMVPRKVDAGVAGHVIIAGTDQVALSLSEDLIRWGAKAFIFCTDAQKAVELRTRGYNVLTGEHDRMETYRDFRAASAAMLAVLETDIRNTNIVFSAREAAPQLPILAALEQAEARDILKAAGATYSLHFQTLLGTALSRRVIKPHHRVSVLGKFEEMALAEAPAMRSPLIGIPLLGCGLRQSTGVNVVGLWEKGRFTLPTPKTVFSASSVLVVAGTDAQIREFNKFLASADDEQNSEVSAVILGGGRVGLAAAKGLERRGIHAVIVDKKDSIDCGDTPHVKGDAAKLAVLEKAGIREASAIIVTSHNDDFNIYLTIYCRRLCPRAQIISRASLERNINGLHMAGADHVLSLSSLVSSTVIKRLSPGNVLMLSERLSVFRYTVHGSLVGKQLKNSDIRDKTRCNVIGIKSEDGATHANPSPDYEFRMSDKIFLIGDIESQEAFRKLYGIDADFLDAWSEREEAKTDKQK